MPLNNRSGLDKGLSTSLEEKLSCVCAVGDSGWGVGTGRTHTAIRLLKACTKIWLSFLLMSYLKSYFLKESIETKKYLISLKHKEVTF